MLLRKPSANFVTVFIAFDRLVSGDFLLTQSKTGISAMALARHLGRYLGAFAYRFNRRAVL